MGANVPPQGELSGGEMAGREIIQGKCTGEMSKYHNATSAEAICT